jgi:tetratricopeptide (TPR) repeat protein
VHHYEHAYEAISAEIRPEPDEVERLREKAFTFALLAANEAGSKLALEQAERFGTTALALATTPLDRSRALEVLGMTYFHGYEGDRAWASLREAIDLLAEAPSNDPGTSDQSLARLCAVALEIVRRAPGTMRHRISPKEDERYFEIGLRAAGPGDSEERARLLIVGSFAPLGVSGDEFEQAIATGEEAAAMAKRLGRVDLESAALDGISSTHHSIGRYEAMEGSIRRRLELAPRLSDPYEIGDIHAMAAWWALGTGRYRESLDLADHGFGEAMPGSPMQGLYCLDFRAAAHFRLGDWDGVLGDVALAEEMLGDRRESPPGFAPMHLALAAFVHDARGDRDAAGRYLEIVRWLEREEDRLDTDLTLLQSRVLARRGQFVDARALLERPEAIQDRRGQDAILEAWCEVVSEEEAWEEATRIAGRAARHAAWAGEPPLALYAERLEGRAAVGGGDPERALDLLRSAAEGFSGLDAVWEAAVTRLDLARALVAMGETHRALGLAEDVLPIFERLGSMREIGVARDLLGRPDRDQLSLGKR